jgi:hypothetical protein
VAAVRMFVFFLVLPCVLLAALAALLRSESEYGVSAVLGVSGLVIYGAFQAGRLCPAIPGEKLRFARKLLALYWWAVGPPTGQEVWTGELSVVRRGRDSEMLLCPRARQG